ncbi:MAG: 5-formyltetrahydrofolate cyclo-ligase [Gammaproteobacteria bacterium]|nr:5-formyltetrahydrofolate cyclo-ligase [Gammaproteobacteria bacterium]MBU2677664.1 5-formyltetrahydrofolate cyclo-ligase [Gammaproteobacteria bacterium]NND48202.1 5-formyltetrahydrofolate cyclo-ligase [Woeseiaceae bacterium]NNL51396.1 5-formyltetrahydrofolate cyclo-ligase [Woeseiaceae bacterium]
MKKLRAMKDLRATALRARRELDPDVREQASAIICQRVIRSREFVSSHFIACFLPMKDEVDTRDIIERAWRANKRIFVPVLRAGRKMLFRELCPDSPLEQDFFGIWEPTTGDFISPRNLDMVVTPTVAFDDENNRIGMGSGYFDRCFSFLRHRKHWFRPKLVGVAFACQKVEKIAPNAWDIPLYRVISDAPQHSDSAH